MTDARIAIVGAGLSGLYAARLLQRQGLTDFVVLEAREAPGGRIASVDATGQRVAHLAAHDPAIDRFDLGPTWFWPGHQPALAQLVDALGLQPFPQFETGDTVVERSPQEPPMRMRGYLNEPPSMRLLGGMGRLIEALLRNVDPTRIATGQTVRRLHRHAHGVEVHSEDARGRATRWQVQHVLLALPPRLAEAAIVFDPALPAPLARQWRTTPTRMAPHAKYLAVYDQPFWRAQGLSGEARSARGPMGEIHDATLPGGKAALFGFLGVPARVRATVPDSLLRAHCRAQLARLFGPEAARPEADILQDWSQDSRTATAADRDASGSHALPPAASVDTGPWQGRLTGIASEWSPQFPGYLAGAVEAAELGVQALRTRGATRR